MYTEIQYLLHFYTEVYGRIIQLDVYSCIFRITKYIAVYVMGQDSRCGNVAVDLLTVLLQERRVAMDLVMGGALHCDWGAQIKTVYFPIPSFYSSVRAWIQFVTALLQGSRPPELARQSTASGGQKNNGVVRAPSAKCVRTQNTQNTNMRIPKVCCVFFCVFCVLFAYFFACSAYFPAYSAYIKRGWSYSEYFFACSLRFLLHILRTL